MRRPTFHSTTTSTIHHYRPNPLASAGVVFKHVAIVQVSANYAMENLLEFHSSAGPSCDFRVAVGSGSGSSNEEVEDKTPYSHGRELLLLLLLLRSGMGLCKERYVGRGDPTGIR